MNKDSDKAIPAAGHGTKQGVSLRRLAVATGIALIVNLLALTLGKSAGASMTAAGPQTIGIMMVAIATLVPMLVAGLLVALVVAKFPIIKAVAGWGGFAFALATSAGSFSLADNSSTAFTLASMHVITGLSWLFAIKPWQKVTRV